MAATAASAFVNDWPVDAVIATDDITALSVSAALRKADLAHEVKVVGIDAIPEAISSIREGTLDASVAVDPAGVGRLAVHTLLMMKSGSPAAQRVTSEPVLITAANVGDPSSPIFRASRAFLGPHSIPPADYPAYGIVAFPDRAIPASRPRFMMICTAYWAAMENALDLPLAESEQMVTVWPVDNDQRAGRMNNRRVQAVCDEAIDNYHLGTAQTALHDARIATGRAFENQGPYLLAWAPAHDKGKSGVLVLAVDLSDATQPEHFRDAFASWKNDIQSKPELWQEGWAVEKVRVQVRHWADRWGSSIVAFLQGGPE